MPGKASGLLPQDFLICFGSFGGRTVNKPDDQKLQGEFRYRGFFKSGQVIENELRGARQSVRSQNREMTPDDLFLVRQEVW